MNSVEIFVLVFIIIGVFVLSKFYYDGKKALSIFPKIDSLLILYKDNLASGYSNEHIFTKMGRARSILRVIVTENEL